LEDKSFELLTQIYGELKDFRKETNKRLTKIETIIENEINPNIKVSLEGYQMVFEKQKEQDNKLESIDNKLEKQDVEITVIKGGKTKTIK
jgi:hypothetical protein